MNFFKNISYFSLLAITLVSCEKDININVGNEDPKLVVHCQTDENGFFNLFIGKSANILTLPTNTTFEVTNARAILYKSGNVIDSFYYNPSVDRYVQYHPAPAVIGNIYKLAIAAPGLPAVEASTILKNDFPVLLGSTLKPDAKTIDGTLMDEVRLRLQDPPQTTNYYVATILIPYNSGGSLSYYPLSCIYTNDPDIANAEFGQLYSDCIGPEMYISDKNFNGNHKDFVFYMSSGSLQNATYGNRLYRPVVVMNNITEEYYKYKRSIDRYEIAQDNPFAEPVTIFTNITNGYGIFAMSKSQADTIR